MPLWPRLNLDGVGRAPNPPPPPKAVSSHPHAWIWLGSFWRCQNCFRFKRQVSRPPDSGCSGKLPPVALTLQDRGHKMVALLCSNSTMLYVCTRCYGYTSGGQFKKLRTQCTPEVPGRLSKSAAAV
eukprot:4459433-Pyramimonas_sp.AAC.1